jgi:hypothetical protein
MIDLAIQGLAQGALVGLDYRSQWRANWCSSVELLPDRYFILESGL